MGEKLNLLAKIRLFLDSLWIFFIHVISFPAGIDQHKLIILYNIETQLKIFGVQTYLKLLGDSNFSDYNLKSVEVMLVIRTEFPLKGHDMLVPVATGPNTYSKRFFI